MRAVVLPHPVPAEPEIAEVPEPEPAPDELLVRVTASAVSGFDLAVAGGRTDEPERLAFPLVLGRDFAGTVVAIGAEVLGFGVGEAVFGVTTRPAVGHGALAEYVTVPASYGVARVPGGVLPGDAGALGLAGSTAVACVDALGAVGEGDTVLVSGATGGVGSFAVQYLAATGARVLCTARPGVQAGFLRDLLGERAHIVDHTAGLAGQVRAGAPDGVTAAVHLAGDGEEIAALVADGGRYVSTAPHLPRDAAARGLTATAVTADPRGSVLDRLAADTAAGRLRVPVTATYALGEAPDAFRTLNASSFGKTAVAVR
ncbi:NADP-dependent oxidoreductase [Streptomyces sp. RFCAC02]|uniref:NADP-dependent oxidoreductase n=1 Tax=Streptomyces sp. RFCAC02 TaxID=2499143 RepID=UPI0010205AF2|nr:NADP-dependent oxidoreductase [Streptomyces sp. RFCAC02]